MGLTNGSRETMIYWPVIAPEDSTATLAPLRPASRDDEDEYESDHVYEALVSQIDVSERAEPGTRQPGHQSAIHPPRPAFGPEFGDMAYGDEPSPIIKIGKHTYIRSDRDKFGPSLPDQHRQLQRRSYQSSRRKSRSSFPPPKSPPERPYGFSFAQEVLFVLTISMSQIIMLVGMAQALVPQYIIGESFPDTTPGDLAWYSASYGLTAGTFVLPSGRLGDLFGHKKIFIIGFVWFAVWELIGGFSRHVELTSENAGTIFFVVARAMQGVGAALLVPNGQAMLGRAYKPGPRKNLVMCLFGAAAPLGFVVGAVVASVFAQLVAWDWAFFTTAAVCAVMAVVAYVVLPPTSGLHTTRETGVALWKQVDAVGVFLGVSGLVLFNFAFNHAPIVGWTTPYTYFLLVMGVMLLVAFIFHELHTSHPLVPIKSLRPMTSFVLGCTAAGWAAFSIWCYYAFSFLQQLRGWSPLLSSAGFAPAPVMGLAASLLTEQLFGRKVRPQIILLISMSAYFVGSLLWATAPVEQSYWLNCFIGLLVMPFGMEMTNPAASILLSDSVTEEHQGTAASLVVTTVNYSISLALGIAGSAEVGLNEGGESLLAGYRAAQYVGLGFGGLGILLGVAFLMQSLVKRESSVESGAKLA